MAAVANPLQELTECFRQSLLPDPVPRKRAEDFLKQAAHQPNYGVTVLQLVAAHNVDFQIRQAAAVNFKNHVKYHWDTSEHEELQVAPMQDGEKEQIKTHITTLMLSTPPQVQAQLSEALSIISNFDFPSKWPSLLPELIEKLRTATDPVVITGVLQTANSIFKRFRFQFKSDELFGDLKYVLNLFCEPLLEFVQRMGQLITANAKDAAALKALFPCLRLACRIFYSLNFQDLPEFFEDHMKEWMDQFHLYLTYDNPLLEESDPDKESVADQVKAAVCENINLYMSKYEEEFRGYLQMFVTDVWSLLMKVGLSQSHDKLAITSIKFLTTVAKSVHHELFKQAEVVQQICEKIVVPNLRMRDDDEELFEMNHVEYIRRDMEGSDTDTRRRTACELVKGLTTYYEQQVTQLFGQYVSLMLQTYASNPNLNWKEKDCAIYLVVALTVRQKTAAQGATATNQLVNIGDFFATQIEPELKKTDGSPVLRADALKFVTTFRSQIPKAACLSLFPHLVALLLDEHNVVHSYAAHCIERLLVVRDAGKPRFTAQDLAPFTQQLLSNLFGALKLPDSQENDYVMKCIMRVISSSSASQYAEGVLAQLTDILKAVCKNPTQPGFNHYLFEAVAALIKQTCAANRAQVAVFEDKLFDVFQIVLQEDVAEFAPYVFQILSQLVEVRLPPLPPNYMALFSPLLTPLLWERSANVPALVRLLQAYLQKAPHEIISQQKLPAVLGVFQKLIASKHTDHQGFFILNTVVENLPVEAVRPYLTPLWTLLFTRLSKSRTVKFVKALVVFLSLFIVKYSATELVDSLEKLQAGIYTELLGGVWLGSTERGGAISITGDIEVKVTSVATTKLLCECPPMATATSLQLWGKLLDTEIALLERSEEATNAQEESDVLEVDEIPGYAASYAQLHNAHKEYQDPLSNIRDARRYLTESLARFTAQDPGKFPPVIAQSLEKKHQDALLRYCGTYGQSIS